MSIDMLKFASELLSRGIASKDQEMINTAQKILSENSNITTVVAPKKPGRKNKAQQAINEFVAAQQYEESTSVIPASEVPVTRNPSGRLIDINQFKMAEREESRARNGIAVNKIKRAPNQFKDDLTLEMDKITPKVKLVPREREPSTKISIICSKCNHDYKVDPIHARENYVCDECIIKAKGKRS
jgi:hypothetical protein